MRHMLGIIDPSSLSHQALCLTNLTASQYNSHFKFFVQYKPFHTKSADMPRNGDGSSDNGPFPEAGHDILHGAGPKEVLEFFS
jgi:hypothetical protein